MTLDDIKNHAPQIWTKDGVIGGIRTLFSSAAELFFSEGKFYVFPKQGCAQGITVSTPQEALQAHLRIENGDFNRCTINQRAPVV